MNTNPLKRERRFESVPGTGTMFAVRTKFQINQINMWTF